VLQAVQCHEGLVWVRRNATMSGISLYQRMQSAAPFLLVLHGDSGWGRSRDEATNLVVHENEKRKSKRRKTPESDL
jgi:hypothetical protein